MKKFLLTLIVTMLTCIGAWAQETILIDGGPEGTTDYSSFKLDASSVPQNMQAGDILKVYYDFESGQEWSYAFSIGYEESTGFKEVFKVASYSYKEGEYSLKQSDVDNFKQYGIGANWASYVKLYKLSLIHYDAPESVSLNKNNITLGIGNTDNTLKATVDPEGANQTVVWSVVSGEEYVDINSTTGEITGKAAGTAVVHATVPGADIPCEECTVTVKQGYTLTATADPTSVTNAIARTITINPVVKFGEEVQSDGFVLSYSLIDNTDDKVTILDNTVNEVSVAADAIPGTKTVLVTVTDPNDVYAGATTTVNFTIVAAPYITMTSVNETSFTVAKGMADHERPQIQVESQVSNGDGTYMDPQPEISYTAQVVEGQPNIVTLTQNSGNVKWFRIDPISTGTTKVKVTASAVVDGVTISDSKTVDVTVTGQKIQFIAADNLTVNYDQPLTLAAIKAAVTKVYTVANSTETELPSSDYEVEIYNGDALVTEDIPAPHSANFTLTIKVKSKNSEYVDADPKDVTVTVTHLKSFTLALNGGYTSIMDNNGQKAVIAPAATYKEDENATPVPVEISSYDMTYTLSAPDVATVVKNDDNTITVTGKNVGTVTVTVKATPTDNTTYAAVTNSIDIEVVAGPRVSLSKETIDGKEYVVVNVPEGGAFGGISDTPKYTSEDNTTIEMLKAAANVKVTGHIANSDVQELVNLIGGIVGDEGNCKILDMGDATMTERINSTEYKCSLVGGVDENGTQCSKSMLNAEKIVLPRPTTDTAIEGGTVLPANTNALFSAWNNNATNEVTELVIPEGWTELADGCFGKTEAAASGQGLANITSLTLPASIKTLNSYVFASCTSLKSVDMSACDELTVIPESAFADCRKGPGDGLRDIKFPPNLEYIYDNAFIHHEAAILMFPPKLKEIHEGAFENYGGANSLTDVFFTGVQVTPNFVARTAFSASTQMCNNSVADNAQLPDGSMAISNGTITRNSYHNGGFLGCILHFPAEAERWKYTDPYRVYNDGGRSKYTGDNEGTWNNKAMFGYNPEGWTPEFASIMTTKGTEINQVEQQAGFLYGTETTRWDERLTGGIYIDGGYPDRTFGSNKLWPSQQQMQNGYTISRAGYLWNGTEMTTRELDPANNVDLRGLYQFIVAFTDAPDSPERWNFGEKYEKGKWYTFCVPFNMTVEEIQNVFGDNTQVCRFSNVTRTTSTDATPNKIVLEFRKSVMAAGGYSSDDKIKVSSVLGSDGKAVDTYADNNTTGIVHHVPYMIKPGGVAGEKDANFAENGSRVLPNFKRVGGAMVFDVVKKSDYTYSFEGIFEPIPLPNHVYFLSKDPDTGDHRLFFSHNATGTLSAYTASVRVRKVNSAEDKGDDDWTAFFNSKTIASGDTGAPIFKTLFADDEDVTEIEIVCGDDKVENNNVYTVNGVLVNGNNLPAGLYIKNGKKFIVK